MSKAGKFLFLFSALFFLGLMAFRFVYGGWHDSMWVPLGLTLVLFFTAAAKERQIIATFLSMRTTQHGMNMGVLILLAFAGAVCINLLAVRYEKKFDWTSDKLNSLSDQSVKAATALKADAEVILLYRNEQAQGENLQRQVRDVIGMYQNATAKIKFSAYNALQRPDLAQKYEFTYGPFAMVVEQGDKRVKIEQPSEEGITRALIKLGHEKKKVIYFVHGHGERELNANDEEGLSGLQQDLSVTYETKPLALYDVKNQVPDDAALVAIIRPTQQFLESEIQGLREYAKRGGGFLLALDPGSRTNIAQFCKTLGVEFKNNYILDLNSQVLGAGPATVMGVEFSKGSEVTRSFGNATYAIFHLASEVKPAPDAPKLIQFDEIIKTGRRTMAINEMKSQIEFRETGPHTVGIVAKGRLSENDKQDFNAIIIGDSDFASNRLIQNNLNRDLILNAVSSLAQDTDLISIRPKAPKGTKLEMTTQGFAGLVLGVLLPIPLLLFLTGGVVWWRRRVA